MKKAARLIIEKYYPRLTMDFQTNKKICDEIASIPSKRLRNKIAGFITHLMKRIAKGPVRGISFKLQEEERERKDNYVPDVSAIESDLIEIDADTKDMLRSIGFGNIAGVQQVPLNLLGARDLGRDSYRGGSNRENRGDRETKQRRPAARGGDE